MSRYIRVQLLPVGAASLVELDDGVTIVGAAVEGGRGFLFVAQDVTDDAARQAGLAESSRSTHAPGEARKSITLTEWRERFSGA